MSVTLSRRQFLVGTAVAATMPAPAIAQSKPVRIGLLTVKTGPLAAGGIQMEQGTIRFLKDRNYTLAGRKVELVVGDTGGNPAGTKTKTQELVERDNVDMIFGPLAAFELLAISDYTAQAKMPDPEPRRRRGHDAAQAQSRTSCAPPATSAQNMHPLADYAAKELKYKTRDHDRRRLRLRLRADGRLPARVRGRRRPGREEAVAAARHPGLHAVPRADQRRRRGRPGLRRLEPAQVHEAVQGRRASSCRCSAAGRPCDDALLKSYGDEAIGVISCSAYTADLDTPSNKRLIEGMVKDYGNIPGSLRGRALHQRAGRRGGAREDRRARPTTRRR